MSTYKESRTRERVKGRSPPSKKSEPGFINVPAVVVHSAAYARLSFYARALLGEVSTLFRPGDANEKKSGNNGSLCLAYSVYQPLGWKRSRFYKSVDELAEAGFIQITRTGGNRIAAYCALSWRRISPPQEKVGQYDPHIVVGSQPHKPWIKSMADHPTLAASLERSLGTKTCERGAKKKDGAAVQPVDSAACYHASRLLSAEASNGLPQSTLEPIHAVETGCDAAHYKNICHGQGDSLRSVGADSLTHQEVNSDAAYAQRMATAKDVCPVFAPVNNVIPLVLSARTGRDTPTNPLKRPALVSAQLESATAEFRELLIVGRITGPARVL